MDFAVRDKKTRSDKPAEESASNDDDVASCSGVQLKCTALYADSSDPDTERKDNVAEVPDVAVVGVPRDDQHADEECLPGPFNDIQVIPDDINDDEQPALPTQVIVRERNEEKNSKVRIGTCHCSASLVICL